MLAFSSDGKHLASVGSDEKNSIAVYDWKGGKLLASTTTGEANLYDLGFVPGDNGSFVACGDRLVYYLNLSGKGIRK